VILLARAVRNAQNPSAPSDLSGDEYWPRVARLWSSCGVEGPAETPTGRGSDGQAQGEVGTAGLPVALDRTWSQMGFAATRFLSGLGPVGPAERRAYLCTRASDFKGEPFDLSALSGESASRRSRSRAVCFAKLGRGAKDASHYPAAMSLRAIRQQRYWPVSASSLKDPAKRGAELP
jgi:hypothetical protein